MCATCMQCNHHKVDPMMMQDQGGTPGRAPTYKRVSLVMGYPKGLRW